MAEISNLPPPSTQPTSALPMSSLPSPPKPTTPSISTLRSWLPLYTSSLTRTDTILTRLSHILSTPSGTDTLLLTLAYTTLLSSSILQKISLARIHHRAQSLLLQIRKLPPHTTVLLVGGEIPVSRLAVLAIRLKALSVLIGDFRIFTRLFGLLGIYTWGKSVWADRNEEGGDKVLRTVAFAQVLVNILFQALENGAYLSSKGVLGWSIPQQNKAWVWSSRYWMSHVLLDFVRLARERGLRGVPRLEKEGKSEVGGVREKEVEGSTWTRQLITNAAWLPLTAHWSTGTGLVSEFWVGVFGSVAGVAGLRARWRDAAMSG